MDFATKLSRLCWHRSHSQRALAEALGAVSKSTVSNWMTGKTDPKLRELAALARLFGVSVDYLVKDELEEPGGDGLGEVQRRVLWAAETVGYEVALRRIMKAPAAEDGDGAEGKPPLPAKPASGPGTAAADGGEREGPVKRSRPRARGPRAAKPGGDSGR